MSRSSVSVIVNDCRLYSVHKNMARGYAYAKIESISVYVRVFRKIEYAYDMLRSSLNSKILERMVFIHANTKLIDKVIIGVCGNRYFEKEVKVI